MHINIENFTIGDNSAVFIIAELSANHNQSFDLAIETIRAMKNAGADAVKIQTYLPESMTLDLDEPLFQTRKGTIWEGQKLFDLYKKTYTPWEWHEDLKNAAEEIGLIFFSSPFDKSAVDFLEKLSVQAFKVASPEITDIPLIEYISSKQKPIILSSGIAILSDLEEAINACRKKGNKQIALLKCTSVYPAPFEEINLRTIPNMRETFNVIPGLSDHTLGISVPIAAVALGAKIIEKHFILDRNIGGPDAKFSLEPNEFKNMVQAIRDVEKALGNVNYNLTEKNLQSRKSARSLFVVNDIKKGENFSEENIRSIRPGYGLHPKFLSQILGKFASKDLKKGSPIEWNMVQ